MDSNTPFPEIPGLAIISPIGEGGMAEVWKAVDRKTGRTVAVKILKPEFAASPEDVRRFIGESKLLETIDHPGVVKSYGVNAIGALIYYTMEFVDGYNFGDFVAQRHYLGETECLLVCESVASALDYAWNEHGIVHCDIKPDNIMINSEGVVKLTDMGLGRTFQFLEESEISVPDTVMGTPAYISPEQVYGDVELDCRSDIYSLAASLYTLATRRVLFPGLDTEAMMRAHCDVAMQAEDPRRFCRLSDSFCRLLEFMLVKNRDYRVSSWEDVLEFCQLVEKGVLFKPRSQDAPSSLRLDPQADAASP